MAQTFAYRPYLYVASDGSAYASMANLWRHDMTKDALAATFEKSPSFVRWLGNWENMPADLDKIVERQLEVLTSSLKKPESKSHAN